MFARVTTTRARPDQVDAAVTSFRERLLPEAQKQKGFKGTLFLFDRKSGNTLGITLWGSEADMKASEERATQLHGQTIQDLGIGGTPTVNHFEVGEHI